MWDFRAYHVRAINANSEEERNAINQELKDVYETLNEADKQVFNEGLQAFLFKQYANLADDYKNIKNNQE